MFSLFSGLYDEYFTPQQVNCLVVGVSCAGKTTLLERMKVTKFSSSSHVPRKTTASTAQANLSPEQLRTSIFLHDNPVHYQAPPTHRSRRRHNSKRHYRNGKRHSVAHEPPPSKFAWICPTPPAALLGAATGRTGRSRLDTSDREESDDDDDHGDDDDGGYHDDNSSDDGTHGGTTTHNTNCGDSDYDDASLTESVYRDAMITEVNNRNHRQWLERRGNSNVGEGTTKNGSVASGPPGLPAPRRISVGGRSTDSGDHLTYLGNNNNNISSGRKSSMETVDLMTGSASAHQRYLEWDDGEDEDDDLLQYDIKPGAKMLQLEKIRPTIGMNLAKIEICGAKVHFWDLGGRLIDLWQRYYADADAVLFVWKLSKDDTFIDGDAIKVSADAQKKVLEQVRSAVADDVPFVILGHLFQAEPPYNCDPDVLYSTSQLLPHYHNPYQALFLANAVTGQGVKTALDWLISTAKRQQRMRERSIEAMARH